VLRGEALRQQLAALEQQRELVLDLHADARRALATLEHLEQAKEGDEALLPLGAGAYAYARLDKPGRAVASLGAGVSAEMPVGDARARMGERVESLDAAMQQLNRDVARVSDELARLNALLEQVYGGA
jgi:prefoldin alpha subunit